MTETLDVGPLQCPSCGQRQPLRELFRISGPAVRECDGCGSRLRPDRNPRQVLLGLMPYFLVIFWVEDHYPRTVLLGVSLVLLVPLALWDAWSSRFAIVAGDLDD